MPQPSSAAGSRQKTLLLLSALAVFFVVDLHSRNAFGLMTSVFPYESFFIPLFVFIAGAFFRLEDAKHPLRYVWKQCRHLLFPYAAVNGGAAAVILLLRRQCEEIRWTADFLPSAEGETSLTAPARLLPLLFFIGVLYLFFQWAVPRQHPLLTFLLLSLVSMGCVGLSETDSEIKAFILKIGCFLPFFHLGAVYQKMPAVFFRKLPLTGSLLLSAGVNILLLLFGVDLSAVSWENLSSLPVFLAFLPLVIGLSGMIFWLALSEIMAPVLGNSHLMALLSQHMFGILCYHIAVFTAFNWFLSRWPATQNSFDLKAFSADGGFYLLTTPDGIRNCYVFVGLFGSLLICMITAGLKKLALSAFRTAAQRKCFT